MNSKFCWPAILNHSDQFDFNCQSGEWNLNYNQKFALKLFSNLSQITNQIEVEPPISNFLTSNDFSDIQKLNNTKLESNSIQLDLDKKMISLVFDESGSQGINDPDKNRYSIAEKFIRRVNDTYPGEILYNLFKFGGKVAYLDTVAYPYSLNPYNKLINHPNCFKETDPFKDDLKDFAGVRILKKTNSFPSTFVDGEIVFEGIANKYQDLNIELDQNYFYKIYTFDQDYNFSNGKELYVNLPNLNVPDGVKGFTYTQQNGTSVPLDDTTTAIWHLNEGSGEIAYDFKCSLDLSFSSEGLRWLNEQDVPVNYSGLRFDNLNYISAIDSNNSTKMLSKFSFLSWINPYSLSSNSPIISRSNGTGSNIDFELYLDATGHLVVNARNVALPASVGIVTENNWVAIGFSLNVTEGILKYYINGILDSTHTVTINDYVEDVYSLYIGNSISLSTKFFGSLTEISIHNDIKPDSYFLKYSFPKENEINLDNGDRLLIFNYFVPSECNYLGGNIKVINNKFKKPYLITDGEIIYEKSNITSGSYYFTYNGGICGLSEYYKIYTQYLNGNYSDSLNSSELTIQVNSPSINFIQSLADTIEIPKNINILTGNFKNYLTWSNTDISETVKYMKIYASTDGYPLLNSDGNFTGELIFTGSINDLGFVHRTYNNDSYYYSLVNCDKYARNSNVVNCINDIYDKVENSKIPRNEVDFLYYEINDFDGINLVWNHFINKNIITGFYNEKVVIFAKLTDDFGSMITSDAVDFSAEIITEVKIAPDAAEDVFGDNQTVSSVGNLYKFVLKKQEDGFVQCVLELNQVAGLLKNYESITFNVIISAIVPDLNSPLDENDNYTVNLFKFTSSPTVINFINPFQMSVENSNNSKVDINCGKLVTFLPNQDVYSVKTYNGIYTKSNTYFNLRSILTFEDLPINTVNSFDIIVYYSDKNLCDDLEAKKTTISRDFNLQNQNFPVKQEQIELLDVYGNPTGNYKNVSYIDVQLGTPKYGQNVLVYIKINYNGYEYVKKYFIVFKNTIEVSLNPILPRPDGVNVREQMASVYFVDPDAPDDISKRTIVPDGTLVKWTLIPSSKSSNLNIYTRSGYNLPGGIYSTTLNGVAKNVFIGPIFDTEVKGYLEDGTPIYNEYTLTASVIYDGYSTSDSRTLEIIPSSYQNNLGIAGSYLLMEFENPKEKLFADGQSYVKMIISHDPSNSTTKYSDCFVSCVNSLGKTLYNLPEGENIYLSANDENLQIISGDVIEYIDPYTGIRSLNTENAIVDTGSSFVELSNGDYTYIYFRYGQSVVQDIIGYEDPNWQCSCFGSEKIFSYKKEINIFGTLTSLIDGKLVNLVGGSGFNNFSNGLIPTSIVPENPVLLNLIGREANDALIDGLIIDGQTKNKLIFSLTISGEPVLNPVKLTRNVINIFDSGISLESNQAYTSYEINTLINPDLYGSYASFTINPIIANKSFQSYIIITFEYTNSLNINIPVQLCFVVSYDVNANYFNGDITSIFSNNLNYFNINSNQWNSLSNLNISRSSHSLNFVNEKLYAIGGVNSNSILSSVEEYDIGNNTWTVKSSMNYPRMGFMSSVFNNEIYVFGGVIYNLSSGKIEVTDKVEKYNPLNDVWEILESMPSIITDSNDVLTYGVSFGASNVINNGSDEIIILSGIRSISANGNIPILNDRILHYNISLNSWTYSDSISNDNFPEYFKINPNTFIKNNSIYVFGGANTDNNANITFQNDIYSYNFISDLIELNNEKFYNTPELRYKTCQALGNNVVYILGGTNSSQTLNTFESIDFSGASFSYYKYPSENSLSESISDASACYSTPSFYSGDEIIFIAGGSTRGKNNKFLTINSSVNERLILNGKMQVGVNINLKDQNNKDINENIKIFVKGFIQLKSVEGIDVARIPSSLSGYQIRLENNEFYINNGTGNIILDARFDDYMNALHEQIVLFENSEVLRYKIVLQIIILDENYYGQTFVSVFDEENLLQISSDTCISVFANTVISDIFNYKKFNLLISGIYQNDAPVVEVKSDNFWIPSLERISNSPLNYSDAYEELLLLSNLTPVGCSPLYDSLSKVSNYLSNEEFDSYKKRIYVFTDNEENFSINTLNETISNINCIDGYYKSPVIINECMFFEDSLLSIYQRRCKSIDLSNLGLMTGGQGYSIISINDLNDILYSMAGGDVGAIGYGNCIFTYNIGQSVYLQSVSLLFDLPSNTDGRWGIQISDDGVNYKNYKFNLEPNSLININSNIKYIRFFGELFSGLSLNNDYPYDIDPIPYSPKITGFDISYIIPKIDYIYTDIQEIPYNQNSAIISINANIDDNNISEILVGINSSNTWNWQDFNTNSQKERGQNSSVFVPDRNRFQLNNSSNKELLENVNGYLFTAKSGSWSLDSSVEIYNSSLEVISSSNYKVYPRSGKIIFTKNQKENNYYIFIENVKTFKLGTKIVSVDSDNPVKLYGISSMWNYIKTKE